MRENQRGEQHDEAAWAPARPLSARVCAACSRGTPPATAPGSPLQQHAVDEGSHRLHVARDPVDDRARWRCGRRTGNDSRSCSLSYTRVRSPGTMSRWMSLPTATAARRTAPRDRRQRQHHAAQREQRPPRRPRGGWRQAQRGQRGAGAPASSARRATSAHAAGQPQPRHRQPQQQPPGRRTPAGTSRDSARRGRKGAATAPRPPHRHRYFRWIQPIARSILAHQIFRAAGASLEK
jgi:hypothetical protein